VRTKGRAASRVSKMTIRRLPAAPHGDSRETLHSVREALEHFRVQITAAIKRDRNILLMWIIALMIARVGVFTALVKLL